MFYLSESISRFSETEFNFIKTQRENNLFSITLNRPAKRNAFTPTMVNEIAFALEYAQNEQDIWCVLINAEGPVFCAGMDLNVFQNPDLDQKNETLPAPQKEVNLGDAFKNLTKPSIAKVEGSVFAGGFLIIGGCTFVISTEEAEFGLPEVKRGLFPMQVMSTLLKVTTRRKALEMCILAKNYSASEAKELGIVTHLSSESTIDEACNSIVESIFSHSPFAIQKGIEAFNAIPEIMENEQFTFLVNKLQEIRSSEDAKEGINAFKEKRKPVWRNK
jgi:enoyl-CoA hydratase/carnithine racemase